MDADFSIELGNGDPVLDLPWSDPAGKLVYFDLKTHPELISQVDEAGRFPELGEFLRLVNSERSQFESAKCDVWTTTELSAEEETFAASHKFASYVDMVFSNLEDRESLPAHEVLARRLATLLQSAPEISSSVEVCVRRLFFQEEREPREGFYCTLYVNGYGSDESSARQQWGIGLKLVRNAIAQLSADG